MKQRVITAVVALLVLVPFLIFSNTPMLLIFSDVLAAVAIGEVLNCAGLLKKLYITLPAMAVSTLVVLLTRLTESRERFFTLAFIAFFALAVYTLTAAVFSRGQVAVTDAALVSVMTMYISTGFSSIILLRDMPNGAYIYILAFLTPWMSDAFAYFTGVTIGRHKLIPDVSPKKTVEGAIGGIVFGTASVVAYGAIVGEFLIEDASARYAALLIAGVVMCVLSQCGDLIASLVKRHYNVKDYGKVFPGHGGVMDRFDSIVATAPFLYILFTLSEFFQLFL